MRRDVGLLGLLLAMTLVGWLLRGGASHGPAPVPLEVDSPGVLRHETAPEVLPWPEHPIAEAVGHATRTEGDGWASTQAVYHVTHPWSAVADWYADHLPEATRLGSPDSALFTERREGVFLTIRVYAEGDGTRVMCLAREEHRQSSQR